MVVTGSVKSNTPIEQSVSRLPRSVTRFSTEYTSRIFRFAHAPGLGGIALELHVGLGADVTQNANWLAAFSGGGDQAASLVEAGGTFSSGIADMYSLKVPTAKREPARRLLP